MLIPEIKQFPYILQCGNVIQIAAPIAKLSIPDIS